MATVKGQNLRVFVDNFPIAMALSCELNIQLTTQQISTKDDESDFANLMVASVSWSAKAQAVVTDEWDEDAMGALDFTGMEGRTVQLQFSIAGGDQNREAGEMLVGGEAIISDVKYTAQNRQRSLYDVVFTGKKNMLFDVRALITTNPHYIVTSNGRVLAAPHEEE